VESAKSAVEVVVVTLSWLSKENLDIDDLSWWCLAFPSSGVVALLLEEAVIANGGFSDDALIEHP
jgi:hypothetical protein